MNRPVFLRLDARAEFDDAVLWYDRQRSGLGARFTAAVQETLDRIAERPETFAICYRDVRGTGVKGFPYSVYYCVEVSHVEVIAIYHARRDPRGWKNRV